MSRQTLTQTQAHFTARAEPDRIAAQVHQQLSHSVAPHAYHPRQLRVQLRQQRNTLLTNAWSQQVNHTIQQAFRCEVDVFDLQFTRLDTGKIQHVVDQVRQHFRRLPRDAHETLFFAVQRHLGEQLQRTADGGQGRAHFVAHGGHEGALRPVRRFGVVAGGAQFAFVPQPFGDIPQLGNEYQFTLQLRRGEDELRGELRAIATHDGELLPMPHDLRRLTWTVAGQQQPVQVAHDRRHDEVEHPLAERFGAPPAEGGFGRGIELDDLSRAVSADDAVQRRVDEYSQQGMGTRGTHDGTRQDSNWIGVSHVFAKCKAFCGDAIPSARGRRSAKDRQMPQGRTSDLLETTVRMVYL